jgi:transposase
MALSDDLREGVVGAVVEGGMSRNAAAKRFGVSIAERRALGGALQGQGLFNRASRVSSGRFAAL